jgi:hypothetical protein
MKIKIEFDKKEHEFNKDLKDVEFSASDFFLAVRYLQPVQEKKVLYHIPKVESMSINGGYFRDVLKEIRQAIHELK